MAAELRGAAAGSGQVQVALAVGHDRVGVVGAIAACLLEPAECSGTVLLHDVNIRGRAAAGDRVCCGQREQQESSSHLATFTPTGRMIREGFADE